jgi:hypothetical protein
VLKCVEWNGADLCFASDSCKSDRETMKMAVDCPKGAWNLACASDKICGDSAFVLELFRYEPNVIQYVSEKLTKDRGFVLEIVRSAISEMWFLQFDSDFQIIFSKPIGK